MPSRRILDSRVWRGIPSFAAAPEGPDIHGFLQDPLLSLPLHDVRVPRPDLSEKSSKSFCCPASPSARRTASWKSFREYRTTAGGVSAPFDNIVRDRSSLPALRPAAGKAPSAE